jgi:hypothetical protein
MERNQPLTRPAAADESAAAGHPFPRERALGPSFCIEGEENERSALLKVLQLVICRSGPAFVFINIPGSFVAFL